MLQNAPSLRVQGALYLTVSRHLIKSEDFYLHVLRLCIPVNSNLLLQLSDCIFLSRNNTKHKKEQ